MILSKAFDTFSSDILIAKLVADGFSKLPVQPVHSHFEQI